MEARDPGLMRYVDLPNQSDDDTCPYRDCGKPIADAWEMAPEAFEEWAGYECEHCGRPIKVMQRVETVIEAVPGSKRGEG